ncbi:MAG TPA: PAS domain S-box protein [Chthonomonadaceae bacterium]|nr:PAS domain S-box protein [Chthonomonadaceae bacterium]
MRSVNTVGRDYPPIRDKEGTLLGIVLIFRDITERRDMERTLQEQQTILQTLFDHIPVLVAFFDTTGQLKWGNREWQRVLGWSLEELHSPQRMAELTLDLAQPQEPGAIAKWAAPVWQDIMLRDKDGRLLAISWAQVRLSDGTRIGIGQDITHRKAQETDIQARNQRLEQAMQETEHRVKNNLHSVAALLDLQVLAHPEAVPVQELTRVRTHVTALAAIHDLLTQDVKAGRLLNLISARAMLQKLLPLLQETVGAPRIQWSAEEVSLPIKQSMSLVVVINELVTNAIKHGGQNVELKLARSEDQVTLEVCDDGPGFPQAFPPITAGGFGLEQVGSAHRQGGTDTGSKNTLPNTSGWL